jgi:M3 family oligoendopeptidase
MSLEFITWPWMEKFFEGDADRFRRAHLVGALVFIPYGCAVDHFQHMVYEKPEATPAQRFAMWQECERMYRPWRDYAGLPHVKDGGYWQAQRHIYLSPFYYIDYVLAQLCALQFWVRADEDRPAAMKDYVNLCARGGEAPFQQLAKGAGLRSPFEKGCLEQVITKARDWLG